jgi:carbamoyl-phosphate synthase large subunit
VTRVLVSSAGDKVPLILGLSRCRYGQFSDLQIIATDTRNDCLSYHFADEGHVVPSTTENNLDALLGFCRSRAIDVVIPTRDGELEFWSQNEQSFLQIGTRISISPPQTIFACFDKLEFYQQLDAHNFPAIPTFLEPEKFLSGKYVVKERFGSASKHLGLNLETQAAISFSRNLNSPIFQPYIEGTEYSVDVWRSRSGDLSVSSSRTRDMVIEGEAKITSTVANGELEKLSREIADLLGVRGIAVIQFIIDPGGQVWVVECNARVGGATTASVAAGAPLFELLLSDNLDLPYAELAKGMALKEITQIRAEKDFIFHK